jgi:hypothetical protein
VEQDIDITNHITPEYVPTELESSMPEAKDWDTEAYGQYIAAEARLPRNGGEIIR